MATEQLEPKLKRFALLLTGNEHHAEQVVRLASRFAIAQDDERVVGTSEDYRRFASLYSAWLDWVRLKNEDAATGGLEKPNLHGHGLDPAMATFLEQCPVQQRSLLLLVYGENYTYRAAARLMELPPEHAMTLLAKARHALAVESGYTIQREPPLSGANENNTV